MDEDGDGQRDGDSDGRADATVDPDAGAGEDVTFALLGGPGDGPTLDLDHERFAYAGKFVVSGTGKAVARAHRSGGDGEQGDSDGEHGEVLAAASFDRDRTDRSVVRIRYVTVRRDRRGEGLGARLLASLAERVLTAAGGDGARAVDAQAEGSRGRDANAERASTEGGAVGTQAFADVREVRIAVNNPFAYEAAFKAGFGYTGERTGLAELLCARPGDRSAETYRRGLSTFLEREDLDEAERAFVEGRRDAGPPATVAPLPDV